MKLAAYRPEWRDMLGHISFGVSDLRRSSAFYDAALAALGYERVFTGECRGRLAAERRGARGFGYDPGFLADAGPSGRTIAELDDAEKDAISHRGNAARALAAWLGA